MPYVPQYVTPPTPPGFVDEEFEYYFDSQDTPALAPPLPGELVAKVVLQLQADAEYIWRAIEISGNTGSTCLRFYDPYGNELSAVTVEADRSYDATLNGPSPLGRLPVVFEPEIRCPAGGFLMVDVYGLSTT